MKLDLKCILSICLLGSSVFASSFSYAEYIPLQETQPNPTLSVFVQNLSSRFQEVFGELFDLSRGISPIEATGVVQTGLASKSLIDIHGHAHQDDIEFLVQKGVVDPNREKFYPDNFLRRYELAIMYVKYQLIKGRTQMPQIIFPNIGWFTDVAQNISYAPYVAYGVQQNRFTDFVGYTTEGKKIFSPNSFVSVEEVLRLISLPVGSGYHNHIKRGEFAHLLVKGSLDELYDTVDTESISDSTVNSASIPNADKPLLNGNQVISTLKTMLSFVQ